MPNSSATGGVLAASVPYPIDDDSLDTVLQALIVQVTGLDGTLVRPRWQPVVPKIPEASVNWCAVGVMSDEPDDGPYLTYDSTVMNGTLIRHETLTAMATFYGPLAKTYAALARDGMSVPQNLEPLAPYALALIDTGSIVNAPELINETWIKRRDFSFRLRRQVSRTYAIQPLVSASVHLIDDTVVDQFFNVPPSPVTASSSQGNFTAVPVYSNVISATLASSQDDYAPSGFSSATSFLRLFAAYGGSTINGLSSTGFSPGQSLVLRNTSTTDSITFTNLASSSSSGNRFACPKSVSAVLAPLTNILLIFDSGVWEFV